MPIHGRSAHGLDEKTMWVGIDFVRLARTVRAQAASAEMRNDRIPASETDPRSVGESSGELIGSGWGAEEIGLDHTRGPR